MRVFYIINILGIILKYISLVILTPCLVALFYKDFQSITPFIVSSLISFFLGSLFGYEIVFNYLVSDSSLDRSFLLRVWVNERIHCNSDS